MKDKFYHKTVALDTLTKEVKEYFSSEENIKHINNDNFFKWIDTIHNYNHKFELLYEHDYVKNSKLFIDIYDKLGSSLTKILQPQPAHRLNETLIEIYREQGNLASSFDFFEQLGFLNDNIVLVGANGSGKTTLSERLKQIISERVGVVIGATKILIIPRFTSITLSETTTEKKLNDTYAFDKTGKVTFETSKEDSIPYDYMKKQGGIFRALLENLLANHNRFVHSRDRCAKLGENVDYTVKSNLEKTLEIWNEHLESRVLKCDDNINLVLDGDNVENSYPAYMMSDGEKVALYYISQVLQAPENGLIVIDEPEMYLHKTILIKLWNRLELERPDCQFIYLTHDLSFASSRIGAKKFWVKSFKHPESWEIKPIPENEIPEELLLELVGSRKKVLFCEGKSTKSQDIQIYEILFPDYTIKSVESCTHVINYTKAYNAIRDLETEACGIIDADHRVEEQLITLEGQNVFGLKVAEIENILLTEDFLKLFAAEFRCTEDDVKNIKEDVLKKLQDDKEIQISNFVSSRINLYFTESHVNKSNKKDEISKNYETFAGEIKIDEWYQEREETINKIIEEKNYEMAIKIYNNKGLVSIVNKHFKMSNFTERAIKVLSQSKDFQEIIKVHFSEKLFK